MRKNGDSDHGERIRVMGIFIGLGCVALLLLGRVAQLQLPGVSLARAEVAKRSQRVKEFPAPRGTMLDRYGQPIAYDRPVYECRAELLLPLRSKAAGDALEAARVQFLQHVVAAFGQDPELHDDLEALQDHARRLQSRLDRTIDKAYAGLEQKGQLAEKKFLKVDFLLDGELDNERVVQALRRMDRRSNSSRLYHFYLHLSPAYERVYTNRELTAGLAGTVNPRRLNSGLERLKVMSPGPPGIQRLLVDALEKSFWIGGLVPPAEPYAIRTTLDLELQREAQEELEGAAEKVAEKYGSLPEWGAMLAVEVASGDILAAASFQAGKDGKNDPYGAFAPTQRAFEPGSVVKPMHIALGLERRKFNWRTELNCAPGYTLRWRRARRRIKDSHDSGFLTPYGIILNSSNIGAVQLAMLSGSEVLEEYLQRYQLGSSRCLDFPGEFIGRRPEERIHEMSPADQLVWIGPSIGFGYELKATTLQIARAYLTLLSGRSRELRLVSHVMQGAKVLKELPAAQGEPFLSDLNVTLVKSAMAAVINGEPGSTARTLALSLKAQGIEPGSIGGKTGTSEFRQIIERPGQRRRVGDVRTASFVGFAPVKKPEVLVVCVLQKADAELFYGGSYAAPAAVRLLLSGLARGREGHGFVLDKRVSASGTWPSDVSEGGK